MVFKNVTACVMRAASGAFEFKADLVGSGRARGPLPFPPLAGRRRCQMPLGPARMKRPAGAKAKAGPVACAAAPERAARVARVG